ncbi:hypothetical protein GCM10009750_12910 [Agromyces salentinus]|uniref:Uncharacterized protein n=1 Tax=Agromyces salentinus TaxID=269421 RepID=A0ABP4YWZ8_9MICO
MTAPKYDSTNGIAATIMTPSHWRKSGKEEVKSWSASIMTGPLVGSGCSGPERERLVMDQASATASPPGSAVVSGIRVGFRTPEHDKCHWPRL